MESPRNLQLNNNKCMLVEFVNESNKVQIGFQTFLSENQKNELEDLIKKKNDYCKMA